MLVSAIVCLPMVAQAGPLANRLHRQDARIYNGVKNGSISPKEYRRLERREDKIEAARLRAIRSGGKLTAAEKHRLNRQLNHNSRAIYRAKHN